VIVVPTEVVTNKKSDENIEEELKEL